MKSFGIRFQSLEISKPPPPCGPGKRIQYIFQFKARIYVLFSDLQTVAMVWELSGVIVYGRDIHVMQCHVSVDGLV